MPATKLRQRVYQLEDRQLEIRTLLCSQSTFRFNGQVWEGQPREVLISELRDLESTVRRSWEQIREEEARERKEREPAQRKP